MGIHLTAVIAEASPYSPSPWGSSHAAESSVPTQRGGPPRNSAWIFALSKNYLHDFRGSTNSGEIPWTNRAIICRLHWLDQDRRLNQFWNPMDGIFGVWVSYQLRPKQSERTFHHSSGDLAGMCYRNGHICSLHVRHSFIRIPAWLEALQLQGQDESDKVLDVQFADV